MALIVYIHGFASSGKSVKSLSLYDSFPEDEVVAPDFPVDPVVVEQMVEKIVSDYYSTPSYAGPVVFVGTSLGGFWAHYFAQKYDAIGVVVNPSIKPSQTMAARIGQPLTNYATGEAIEITEQTVAEFVEREKYLQGNTNGYLLHLFLAKDDDKLPWEATAKELKFANSVTVTDTGGHRYDSEWYRVVNKLREIVNT